MVPGISNMFVTGPDVIKAVTGEDITLEELGGAGVHGGVSGVAHFTPTSERECLSIVKKLLSFLPSNNVDDPPRSDPPDAPPLENEALNDLIPVRQTESYDVHALIEGISTTLIFSRFNGFRQERSRRICAAGGQPVGVIANQPSVLAGVLDIDSSDKVARMVRFCDSFNLPIITFVDVPGFLPGSQAGVRRDYPAGAKVLYAYSEATVPKISIIVRKAYGGAYIAFSNRDMGFDRVLAYPTAEIAVMGPGRRGQRHLPAGDCGSLRPRGQAAGVDRGVPEEVCTPYSAAALSYVDSIIEPGTHAGSCCARGDAPGQAGKPSPKEARGTSPCKSRVGWMKAFLGSRRRISPWAAGVIH